MYFMNRLQVIILKEIVTLYFFKTKQVYIPGWDCLLVLSLLKSYTALHQFRLCVCVCRAGHFRYFFIFSIIKDDFFALFIMLITYFCTVLFKKPTPSQINLIKSAKNHFLLVKKLKNTWSAHLCICVCV